MFWFTQHTSTILRPLLFPSLRSRLQSPFPIGRRAWPRFAAVAAAAALWMHTWAAVTRALVTAASSEAARRAGQKVEHRQWPARVPLMRQWLSRFLESVPAPRRPRRLNLLRLPCFPRPALLLHPRMYLSTLGGDYSYLGEFVRYSNKHHHQI